jgi:hypothetical protein
MNRVFENRLGMGGSVAGLDLPPENWPRFWVGGMLRGRRLLWRRGRWSRSEWIAVHPESDIRLSGLVLGLPMSRMMPPATTTVISGFGWVPVPSMSNALRRTKASVILVTEMPCKGKAFSRGNNYAEALLRILLVQSCGNRMGTKTKSNEMSKKKMGYSALRRIH